MISSNVLPTDAKFYVGDGPLPDAKLVSDSCLVLASKSPSTNFKNLNRCQFVAGMTFALNRSPALREHVVDVVSLGSKKEMIGVVAGAVIAVMENEEARTGVETQIELGTHTVNRSRGISESDEAIPELVASASPFPAPICCNGFPSFQSSPDCGFSHVVSINASRVKR